MQSAASMRGSASAIRNVRNFRVHHPRLVNVGDPLPSVDLQEGVPSVVVNLAKETSQGKYLVIGVPGAFSPGCSAEHVPGYINSFSQFHDKGVEKIFIVSVNDAFVSGAWAKELGANNNVRILADSTGDFTDQLDLSFDASKFFGNARSKRYALIIQDGKVVEQFVEPDAVSVKVSAAPEVLKYLK